VVRDDRAGDQRGGAGGTYVSDRSERGGHECAHQQHEASRAHLASIQKMVVRATCAAGLALTLLARSCTPATPAASGSPRSSRGASHLQLIEAEAAQTLHPALSDDSTTPAICREVF